MAQNYSAFSEEIKDVTAEEEVWLNELAGLDWLEPEDRPRITEMLGLKSFYGETPLDDAMEGWGAGFQWELADPDLWLYCEEWFNMDHVVVFVQAFLRRFRPAAVFYMTWADWCSKPRIGEFGGGAVRISATSYEIKHAYSFREEWEREEEE